MRQTRVDLPAEHGDDADLVVRRYCSGPQAARVRDRHRSACATALALLLAVIAVAAQATTDEYRLKAAFIYRFPQFVEWPPAAFRERRTVDLCVLEPNPFGSALDQLVTGETLGERPFAVRRIRSVDEASSCHVLYVPREIRAAAALRAVGTHPVLTVSDAEGFLDDGGMIQLRLENNRVRFDVSVPAAERAGLHLSAQLLRLAGIVRGGRS